MFVTVALIHPSVRIVGPLTAVAREVMADVDLIHIADDGLTRMVADAGGMTEPVTRRVCSYAVNAQESGAEVVMLTSASIGGALDAARAAVRIPVLRIDEAMAEIAVQFGESVGVLGSSPICLDPTVALLRERADAQGKTVAFDTWLCEDAAAAVAADDLDAYDRIVLGGIERLAREADVVVLAETTMDRVARAGGERVRVPVLSSPTPAFEHMAKTLNYFRR